MAGTSRSGVAYWRCCLRSQSRDDLGGLSRITSPRAVSRSTSSSTPPTTLRSKQTCATQVDVAWNSPLAWVKSQIVSRGACRAVAMRDSDRDLTTKVLVRANSATGLAR